MKVSKNFKVLKVKGDTWTYEEKQGNLIENKYDVDVFAYKEYNTWLVADGETGLHYAIMEKTLKEAKSKVKELFDKMDADTFQMVREGQTGKIKEGKQFIG